VPRLATVYWKFNHVDPKIASVRYRGLRPVELLRRQGVRCELIAGRQYIEWNRGDLLVNVKSYTFHDLELVQSAHRSRVPVILDLCDNLFVESYVSEKTIDPVHVFKQMAQHASLITVPTESLAEQVRENLQVDISVIVIPDGIERPDEVARFDEMLASADSGRGNEILHRWRTLENRAFLRSIPGMVARAIQRSREQKKAKPKTPLAPTTDMAPGELARDGETARLLWFGNHGAKHARFGMLDLLNIKNDLEKLSARRPAELVVVSNNEAKYRKYIEPFAIPTRYAEWNSVDIYNWIRSSDVVLIPNSGESFSLCKSANRAVLSLSLETPVVASRTPAYEKLRDCVLFDDWLTNITTYLDDVDARQRHLDSAADVLRKYFSDQTISKAWTEALRKLIPPPQNDPTGICFVANLIQDVEVIKPFIERGHWHSRPTVFLSIKLVEEYPHVWLEFNNTDRVILSTQNLTSVVATIGKLTSLVTASESNLRPHKLTHSLTKYANKNRIPTATLQHGFENIGLTYSDEHQPIQNIKFAANHIYTWCVEENLHPEITEENKRKCIPIGCPKYFPKQQPVVETDRDSFECVIGVFENLHWLRYSDDYRAMFLDSLNASLQEFKDTLFLLRPHQAGQWLTKRFKGTIPSSDNLQILSPADKRFAKLNARQLFPSIDAVVTTPSTVAIDAVLAELPVAVFRHDLILDNYNPLPTLAGPTDWRRFVQEVSDPARRSSLVHRQKIFCDKHFPPGDPIDNFCQQLQLAS